MRFPVRIFSVVAVAALLLAGCGEKAALPVPVATLERPVLTLDAKAGRVLVPQALLVERSGVPGVFVLSAENQARFRMVRTGKTVNGRIEILSGLSGSESLVTGDLRDVHDGSPVKSMSAADKHKFNEGLFPSSSHMHGKPTRLVFIHIHLSLSVVPTIL